MADWLEAFVPLRIHVLVRFGRWDELIAEPLPDDAELYCTTAATIHYGRGVAHAVDGQSRAGARRAGGVRRRLRDDPGEPLPVQQHQPRHPGRRRGHARRRNRLPGRQFEEAFTALRRAIELDDALPYDEPWGWMQPTRHAYGALLLEQGQVEEAAAVYAADLGLDPTLAGRCQHPGNVWSLHGYHECLLRLGRAAEAGIIGQPARTGGRARRRADPGVVRMPAGGVRRMLRLSTAPGVITVPRPTGAA